MTMDPSILYIIATARRDGMACWNVIIIRDGIQKIVRIKGKHMKNALMTVNRYKIASDMNYLGKFHLYPLSDRGSGSVASA